MVSNLDTTFMYIINTFFNQFHYLFILLLPQPYNLPITKRQQQNKYIFSKSIHPPTFLKQIQKILETRNFKIQVTKTYSTT